MQAHSQLVVLMRKLLCSAQKVKLDQISEKGKNGEKKMKYSRKLFK